MSPMEAIYPLAAGSQSPHEECARAPIWPPLPHWSASLARSFPGSFTHVGYPKEGVECSEWQTRGNELE